MHARENVLIPFEHGRLLAANIEGARFVESGRRDTVDLAPWRSVPGRSGRAL
ncbi:MAG: hypothetical protein ACRDWB_08865 [Acidimicrobiales bacterium]